MLISLALPFTIYPCSCCQKLWLQDWINTEGDFFWQVSKNRKRYYLVKWTRICRSKNKGGLGVKDLHKQNLSLPAKWWWKLETKNGLWQDIIKARYLRRDTIASVKGKTSDSPCWKAIMKVKDLYMAGRRVVIQSGNIARSGGILLGIKCHFVNNSPDCSLYAFTLNVLSIPV